MSNEDDFDALYGSKFIGAADLKGKEPRCCISNVEIAELKDKGGATKRKYVLSFEGAGKQMVINKTNAQTLAGAFGKDIDKWVGQFVQLYATDTQFGPGTRIRPVHRPLAATKPAQTADLPSDSVPF